MLFRKLVLSGGGCILLLAYHGGYLLRTWPWLFYYAMVAWGVAFSWYFFATPKADLVPEKINKNEKQIPIAGQSQTNRYKQNDSDSSLISHNINFSSTGINHSESIINNGSDCSYSDSSDSGCGGSD